MGQPERAYTIRELRELRQFLVDSPATTPAVQVTTYVQATATADSRSKVAVAVPATSTKPEAASVAHDEQKNGRGIVIALHGINTRGEWQKDVATPISEAGFTPVLLDYGHYRIHWIILPWVRASKQKWLLDEYTRLREKYGEQKISIVAHSFGTYIVAKTMKKYDYVRFDQIILCGSIVHRRFDWKKYLGNGQASRVLNETGGLDLPVRISVTASPGMGASGAYGFKKQHPRLIERRFAMFGHSDYFNPLHFKEKWIPFLLGADPAPAAVEDDEPTNWWFYVGWAIAIVVIGLVGWMSWGFVTGKLATAVRWIVG